MRCQDDKKGLLYSVEVALDKSKIMVDGRYMPLTPGMSVKVEIKTGERRVIEYVLSLFCSIGGEAAMRGSNRMVLWYVAVCLASFLIG